MRSVTLSALRAWDVSSAARVNHFVANSRFVARRIQTYYGRPAEVIHPPVETELFTPGAGGARRRAAARGTAWWSRRSPPTRRSRWRWRRARSWGCELRVVGTGPERERLEEMAGSRTRFLGHVDSGELRDLYRGARFFLQPGVEDFGIASVEALACGTPVVAAARGGILDVVDDGRHGVLYPDWAGPPALCDAIDKARRIGFNALDLRDRAESFSAARFVERLRSRLSRRFPS